MSLVTVVTAFNIELEFKQASFGKRMLAVLIDMVVISVYAYVAERLLVSMVKNSSNFYEVLSLSLLAIPAFLYNLLCEVWMNGQTLGKKLMAIKVISLSGEQPTLSQYLIRFLLGFGTYIFYAIPSIILEVIMSGGLYLFLFTIAFFFYLPDAISIGVTKHGQRLGDIAAGTTVIDLHHRTGIDETIFQQVADVQYQPLFPQVMRLSDKDINSINNLLRQKNDSNEHQYYLWQIAIRIKEHLAIDTDLEPIPLFQQLLKDYNFLSQR